MNKGHQKGKAQSRRMGRSAIILVFLGVGGVYNGKQGDNRLKGGLGLQSHPSRQGEERGTGQAL